MSSVTTFPQNIFRMLLNHRPFFAEHTWLFHHTAPPRRGEPEPGHWNRHVVILIIRCSGVLKEYEIRYTYVFGFRHTRGCQCVHDTHQGESLWVYRLQNWVSPVHWGLIGDLGTKYFRVYELDSLPLDPTTVTFDTDFSAYMHIIRPPTYYA